MSDSDKPDDTNRSTGLTEDRVREIVQNAIMAKQGDDSRSDSDEDKADDSDDSSDGGMTAGRSRSGAMFRDDTSESVKYITDPERFKNRTRLAWVSMFAMIGFAYILIFKVPPANVEAYGTIIAWCMSTFAAVILAYMGATSYTQTVFAKVMDNRFTKKKDK